MKKKTHEPRKILVGIKVKKMERYWFWAVGAKGDKTPFIYGTAKTERDAYRRAHDSIERNNMEAESKWLPE